MNPMIDRNLSAESLFTLAEATRKAGKLEAAIALYEQVLAVAPAALEPRIALSHALLVMNRPRAAMTVMETAVGLDPYLQSICRDVDSFISEEARSSAALENCTHILKRYPRYAPAHYGMACALLNLGRTIEACRASERALMIDATVPTYYHPLIYAGNAKQVSNAVAALEQLAENETAFDSLDRATLHFLLAKAYGDQERTADSFLHLEKGNAIKRKLVNYDEAYELGQLRAIADAFTSKQISALDGAGYNNPQPIFVVGMPRSGTSLVEQILASHPEVHGAGEIPLFPDLVAQRVVSKNFIVKSATMSATELTELGRAYVSKTSEIAPNAHRIVDKFPYNFRNLGLIRSALPRAQIIHVKRDPLDTCFSCFQHTFAGDVGFAYDQGELGRYYNAYVELMAHWRAVLPTGAMHEVQYEELIQDLPAVARRMMEFCGLSWDLRCLEFYKTERAVATASFHQVRQPIYRSSMGRAKTYLTYLSALCATLA
jgi:tetratricopeptide (TPR) repeat protein